MLKELWVPAFVSKFSNLREQKIHTWSDYLSCAYCVYAFLFCAALTGWYMNFSTPIRCIAPQQWPKEWGEYLSNLCLVKSTYLVPDFDDFYRLNPHNDDFQKQFASYYQWIPTVLFLMPFLFFMPKIFWTFSLSRICALNLDTLITEGEGVVKDLSEKRAEKLNTYCEYLQKNLDIAYNNRLSKFIPTTIVCFIVTKWLYVLTAVMQLYIIMQLVNTTDVFWAFNTVIDSIQAGKWRLVENFQYVSFCDVSRSDFANVNKETIQCLLVMNMLNDKYLAFLSIWMCMVLTISVIVAVHATIIYAYALVLPSFGDHVPESRHSKDGRRMKKVLNKFIRSEGIFVLNILKAKISPLFASEVATQLWKRAEDSEILLR